MHAFGFCGSIFSLQVNPLSAAKGTVNLILLKSGKVIITFFLGEAKNRNKIVI